MAKGALPLALALRYGSQIADGLDKTHSAGVVHRDLKPGNIIITKSGPKILDFGLAKLRARDESAPDLSAVTAQKPLTEKGTILGTLQYMAPEQLEGGEADARTDIFAFGALLYEMVTGKKAFGGKSQASLISAIMTAEPTPPSELEPVSPPVLDRILGMCLAKDPAERWQSAHDLTAALTWIPEASVPSKLPASRRWPRAVALGLAAAALGAILTGLFLDTSPESAAPIRFAIPPPTDEGFGLSPFVDLAISPDGARIAFVGPLGAINALYVRNAGELEANLVGSNNVAAPFFSPDGEWVGYFDFGERMLKKVSSRGGTPVNLCDIVSARFALFGGSWGADDEIIFGSTEGLRRVLAAGGQSEALTVPDATRGEASHVLPHILPGGEAVLFTIIFDDNAPAEIAVFSLSTGERKTIVQRGRHARYANTGHLVYGVENSLHAVAFDLDGLDVVGKPQPVVEDVVTKRVAANFDISGNGTLVYSPGDPVSSDSNSLVWVGLDGREELLAAEPRRYAHPRLSPDGRRVALEARSGDIWMMDVERGGASRFTFDAAQDSYPVWTPDGSRLVFASDRQGKPEIYWKAADGTGAVERVSNEESVAGVPHVMSPDGELLLFINRWADSADIGVVAFPVGESSELILHESFHERWPDLSPDGRWIAYSSDESGMFEIYVKPFPDVDQGKWQISTEGGNWPVWSPDGRELYYFNRGMMAVEIETEPTVTAGPPRVLFQGSYLVGGGRHYDLAPDGERFLMIRASSSEQINVVLNWFEELERLVPTDN